MDGYKHLITYKLSLIIFDLTWDFTPQYYYKYEDSRQRDQLKQAARSTKQNIVEGSSERSLSSKLKLYDVAKASSRELLEDFEDILRRNNLPRWDKNDPRLIKTRTVLENFSSDPSNPPAFFSSERILEAIEGNKKEIEEKRRIEIITNYLVDLLYRLGYLLDKQIQAVEEKHRTEGGYNENLLKRRLEYKKSQG